MFLGSNIHVGNMAIQSMFSGIGGGSFVLPSGFLAAYSLIESEDNGLINGASRHGPATPYGDAIAGTGCYFDGTSDSISIADSTDWYFAANDMSISCKIKPLTVSGSREIINQRNDPISPSNFWQMRIEDGKLRFQVVSGGSLVANYISTDAVISSGNQYDLVLVRIGTSLTWTVNGVSVALTASTPVGTNAFPNIPTGLLIGLGFDETEDFHGLISELVITNNGTTVLDCLNTGLTDNTGRHTITAHGNAAIKSGAIINALSDRFDFNSGPTESGIADFTVEGWANITWAHNGQIFTLYDTTSGRQVEFWCDSSEGARGMLVRLFANNSYTVGWNLSVADDTWFHARIVRSGTTMEVFINGASVGSVTVPATTLTITSFHVGYYTGAFSCVGQYANYRVSTVARDSGGTFTPPTRGEAFENDEYTVLNAPFTADQYDHTIPDTSASCPGILDSSDNLNHGSQATAANQPTYQTGKLVADGTNDHYDSNMNINQPFTVVAKLKVDASAGKSPLMGDGAAAALGFTSDGYMYANFTDAVADSTDHRGSTIQATWIIDGASSSLRIGGSEVASGDPGATDWTSPTILSDGTDYFDGDLITLVIYPSALSGSDLTDAEGVIAAL